jgi:hypothetical protein
MRDFAITPSIAVTIGRQTRLYHAFVTTAPAELDSPSTLTLYLSTLAEVSGFAATPVVQENRSSQVCARLVLVDASELAWQRARCRGYHHVFAPADPVLVAPNTLQHWLWQRLQAPADREGASDGNSRPTSSK